MRGSKDLKKNWREEEEGRKLVMEFLLDEICDCDGGGISIYFAFEANIYIHIYTYTHVCDLIKKIGVFIRG